MTSQHPHPIQKTTFSSLSEFSEWLDLVSDLSGEPIKKMEVTRETWNMIISEWQRSGSYMPRVHFRKPVEGTWEEMNNTLLVVTADKSFTIVCKPK